MGIAEHTMIANKKITPPIKIGKQQIKLWRINHLGKYGLSSCLYHKHSNMYTLQARAICVQTIPKKMSGMSLCKVQLITSAI